MLRYLTGGESHGKSMITIVEGVPSGLPLKASDIDDDLCRRQGGYGRGGRMSIERDRVEFVSGVRQGYSLGSPITMMVKNLDWENWKNVMSPAGGLEDSESGKNKLRSVTRPRPGHADLAGALKYNHKDLRNVLERSSARETAVRVAVGAVCKKLLKELGIKVVSWVVEIGGVRYEINDDDRQKKYEDMFANAERSEVRCPDKDIEKMMKSKIDEARKNRDTVGGTFEIIVANVPPGLGSHVHWDKKLNARLAGALMSIQAIKGVEIGIGFEVAKKFGSKVHDEILQKSVQSDTQSRELQCDYASLRSVFYRKTNNAGGIEGGMSNGEPIVLRAAMKPIPTLMRALQSVDIKTKKPFKAAKERSDICAVPAASIVGEGVVAFEIARAALEKFGGDSIDELKRNYQGYLDYLRRW